MEIKSFLQPSPMRELEQAVGQYVFYRRFLDESEPGRRLYLAIGHLIYEGLFQRPAVRLIIEDTNIPLLVVNVENEEVLQWIG